MTCGIRENGLRAMSCIAAFLVGLTASIGAQQQAPGRTPSQDDLLKSNVQLFEMALKNSIIKAGIQVAEWARKIEPSVDMQFVAQPEVRAVPLLDNSLVFHVDVSEIGINLPSQLWVQLIQQKGYSVGPGRVGPGGGAVRAGNTPVPDDPIKAPAVGMTPSQYFTEQVREGLISTMLDSSTMLPMRAGQTLTVACNPVDSLPPGELRNTSRKLVLTIKGEDLLALRQGTLSRDEAKQRINERRF